MIRRVNPLRKLTPSRHPYLLGSGISGALIAGAVAAFVSITALVSSGDLPGSATSGIAPGRPGSEHGVSNGRRVAPGSQHVVLRTRCVAWTVWAVGSNAGWRADRAEDARRTDIGTAGQLYCWHRTHGALHDQTFIRA